MKIRKGFVSNSSSSSFIMGIAKINDINKLRDYIKVEGIDATKLTILSKVDLKDKPWTVEVRGNFISVESFIGSSVELDISKLSPLDTMLIFESSGGDDSDFWDGDEYDYDIDLSFFDDSEIRIYDMFSDKNSGLDIKTSKVAYGAGRDG